ncbi:MAG: DUF202 domain-containing protein [Saprospiraceae bacterium]|nr:DUF202 domain-containing protein [Saprospiraceae bacterium]
MSEQIPSVENEIILRDILAIDRTRLANQRTLLSFIRTGLYFIATAVGIAFLRKNDILFGWKEWSLTGIGVLSIVVGIINYLLMRKKIRHAYK